MGLDNGLIIRAKTAKALEMLKENFAENRMEYRPDPSQYEFSYWRKCFNMRDRMFYVFGKDVYDGMDTTLTLEQLQTFVDDVLIYFLDKKHWTSNEGLMYGSIWEWHEMLPHIAQSISDIQRFIEIIEESDFTDADFHIYWYDSY